MKKLSSTEDKLVLFFALKAVVFSIFSLIALSYLFSLIILKLDLGSVAQNIISVLIMSLSAIISSYFSLGSFKNNGSIIGIVSVLPLILFSLFNLIFNENTIVLFIFKTFLIALFGALFGILRVNSNKKLKV